MQRINIRMRTITQNSRKTNALYNKFYIKKNMLNDIFKNHIQIQIQSGVASHERLHIAWPSIARLFHGLITQAIW